MQKNKTKDATYKDNANERENDTKSYLFSTNNTNIQVLKERGKQCSSSDSQQK
jgi:hypothetical protein